MPLSGWKSRSRAAARTHIQKTPPHLAKSICGVWRSPTSCCRTLRNFLICDSQTLSQKRYSGPTKVATGVVSRTGLRRMRCGVELTESTELTSWTRSAAWLSDPNTRVSPPHLSIRQLHALLVLGLAMPSMVRDGSGLILWARLATCNKSFPSINSITIWLHQKVLTILPSLKLPLPSMGMVVSRAHPDRRSTYGAISIIPTGHKIMHETGSEPHKMLMSLST